jgi:GNAT superfamily N-acetyltransferase
MQADRIDPRITWENRSVRMLRDGFDGVPRHELAAGYRLRPFRDGDDVTWTGLQRAAEPFFDIGDDLFEREYGTHRDDLPDRMWFVETEGGEAAGSISAWYESNPPVAGERGRIHWVVVHPDHQGRGISKAMMTTAMDRLAADHQDAILGTSTGRPWAIKVYLDFGFLPDDAERDDPPQRAAWEGVQSLLNHSALAAWLGA